MELRVILDPHQFLAEDSPFSQILPNVFALTLNYTGRMILLAGLTCPNESNKHAASKGAQSVLQC